MEHKNYLAIEDSKIIYQSDVVRYEDVYTKNHFITLDSNKLSDVIATVLAEILRETDKIHDSYTTAFHAKTVPGISIKDYLQRIVKCSKCSQECLILALIYIDRITEKNKNFLIKSLNIHR